MDTFSNLVGNAASTNIFESSPGTQRGDSKDSYQPKSRPSLIEGVLSSLPSFTSTAGTAALSLLAKATSSVHAFVSMPPVVQLVRTMESHLLVSSLMLSLVLFAGIPISLLVITGLVSAIAAFLALLSFPTFLIVGFIAAFMMTLGVVLWAWGWGTIGVVVFVIRRYFY